MLTENDFLKLEDALIRAGRTLPYPATPPLAARVRATIDADHASLPRQWRIPRHRLAWTLAAALVLALALLLAFPPARDAIAQLLGLRTVRIIQVTPTPTPTGTLTPAPTPTPGVVPVTQCCETTLIDARRQANFTILLPPAELPTQVFFQNVFGSQYQQVILVFGDPRAPRYVLYEAHNLIYQKLVPYGKEVGAGTIVDVTQVNGNDARWLSGAPHVLVTLDPNGQPLVDTERPVGANTLVWESSNSPDAITYRLETNLGEADAIRFAESLR